MPIFEYVCQSCGYKFEKLILDPGEEVRCTKCQSDRVHKAVSLFTCTTVQLNKKLKMESEDKMKKGREMMKGQKMRKERIKIL